MLCQSSCIVCTQCGWIKSICGISVWNKLRVIRAFLTLPAFLHHRCLEHLHNVEQNNVTFLFQTLAVLTRQAGFAIQVQVQNSVVYVFFFQNVSTNTHTHTHKAWQQPNPFHYHDLFHHLGWSTFQVTIPQPAKVARLKKAYLCLSTSRFKMRWNNVALGETLIYKGDKFWFFHIYFGMFFGVCVADCFCCLRCKKCATVQRHWNWLISWTWGEKNCEFSCSNCKLKTSIAIRNILVLLLFCCPCCCRWHHWHWWWQW